MNNMIPSHLRVWDLVDYSLAESGKGSFLQLYERLTEDIQPPRSLPQRRNLLFGAIAHELSSYLWQIERKTVQRMYERNRYSRQEFLDNYRPVIEQLIDGKIVIHDLTEARNKLRSISPENDINQSMQNFSQKFVELRYSNLKDMLRQRKLPNIVAFKKSIQSNCLGPLIVGRMDVTEYEDGYVNIRELKLRQKLAQDALQLSIYGILEASELSGRENPQVRTFLDYVPSGPMLIEINYENGRAEARRLANAVVEMLKKSKDEVKKWM